MYFAIVIGTYLVGFLATARYLKYYLGMDPKKPTDLDIFLCVFWPVVGPVTMIAFVVKKFWQFSTMSWKLPKFKRKKKTKKPCPKIVLCDACRAEMPHKGPLS